MELAYDAAIDWAYINKDDSSDSDKVAERKRPQQGPSLLTSITNGTVNKKKNDDSSDSEDLDVMDMWQVKCYNCDKRGHFARDCRKPPKNSDTRSNSYSRSPSTRPNSRSSQSTQPKHSRSQKEQFYMLDSRVYPESKSIFGDNDSESESENT